MRMSESRTQMQYRAAEALKHALTGVSAINLKTVKHDSEVGAGQTTFMAYVEIYGHMHSLACEVQNSGHAPNARTAVAALRIRASLVDPSATPVLIVPSLTSEIQKACKESRVGVLDLEGNVRISLGDVFIVKRIMPVEIGELAGAAAASAAVASAAVLIGDPLAIRSVPAPSPAARARRSQTPVGNESAVGFAVA